MSQIRDQQRFTIAEVLRHVNTEGELFWELYDIGACFKVKPQDDKSPMKYYPRLWNLRLREPPPPPMLPPFEKKLWDIWWRHLSPDS